MRHEASRHLLHLRRRKPLGGAHAPSAEFGSQAGRERMSLETATRILQAVVKTHESHFSLPPPERSLPYGEERDSLGIIIRIPQKEGKIKGFNADDVATALTVVATSLLDEPRSTTPKHAAREMTKQSPHGTLRLSMYPDRYIRLELTTPDSDHISDIMSIYMLGESRFEIDKSEISFAFRSSFHDKDDRSIYDISEQPEVELHYSMRGLRWLCANLLPQQWHKPQVVMPDKLDRIPYVPITDIFRRARSRKAA